MSITRQEFAKALLRSCDALSNSLTVLERKTASAPSNVPADDFVVDEAVLKTAADSLILSGFVDEDDRNAVEKLLATPNGALTQLIKVASAVNPTHTNSEPIGTPASQPALGRRASRKAASAHEPYQSPEQRRAQRLQESNDRLAAARARTAVGLGN